MSILERTGPVPLKNPYGEFDLHGYEILGLRGPETHLALVYGTPDGVVPVRINSACLTGEVFHDLRCDCAWQLSEACRRIVRAGQGIVTYHPSDEGRGIGLMRKLRSIQLVASGLTSGAAFTAMGEPIDTRDYSAAILILRDLGVSKVKLFTNNPHKRSALTDAGIEVDASEEIAPVHEPRMRGYLENKVAELGHTITFPQLD